MSSVAQRPALRRLSPFHPHSIVHPFLPAVDFWQRIRRLRYTKTDALNFFRFVDLTLSLSIGEGKGEVKRLSHGTQDGHPP